MSEPLSRAQQLALIWRHTHRDARSKIGQDRMVLVLRPSEGTCLVPLDALTEEEIARKLPYALSREAERHGR